MQTLSHEATAVSEIEFQEKTLISIEVQLSETVFRQFQQALDRYRGHSADSLFAEAVATYLAVLGVLEASEQKIQFQRLVAVLESCALTLLDNQHPC